MYDLAKIFYGLSGTSISLGDNRATGPCSSSELLQLAGRGEQFQIGLGMH